jgi:hypothetical protein
MWVNYREADFSNVSSFLSEQSYIVPWPFLCQSVFPAALCSTKITRIKSDGKTKVLAANEISIQGSG